MRIPWIFVALVAVVLSAAGCGKAKDVPHNISVFAVHPGQCFEAPTSVKVQLSQLKMTPCTKPHTQEAYAVVKYESSGAGPTVASTGVSLSSSYPGSDVLTTFAQGVCAQQYSSYVGVNYLDSKLFFTYLLPSARSWTQADDRNVICFVTTTGATLTTSVKGSKL